MIVGSLRLRSGVLAPLAVVVLTSFVAGCKSPDTHLRSDAIGVQQATTPATYRTVDATGSFWSFWNAHAASGAVIQANAFRAMVVGAHPELFEVNVIKVDPTRSGSDLDERLGPYLVDLPVRIDTMRKVSVQIATDLERYDSSFRELFPNMRWSGTVYFTVSVDAFDGAVRRVNGESCLLFGIDKIAKLHGPSANLGPLFHHELFHVHHSDVNPEPDVPDTGPHGLLEPLWREGLAVYISSVLHPNASASELLLSDQMVREGTEKLPELAGELGSLLDDAKESDYRDFFLGRGQRPDVPRRVAYFVGFLVAKELAKDQPLAALVALRGPELRSAVDGVLSKFADSKASKAPSRSSPSGADTLNRVTQGALSSRKKKARSAENATMIEQHERLRELGAGISGGPADTMSRRARLRASRQESHYPLNCS
jgi:hypothetical protein